MLCAMAAALAVFATPCKSFAIRQDEIKIAPPPPRVFSDEEKARLAAVASDRRKRLRLSLELATARLMRAEQLTTQQLYANASIELGGYEALVENAFAFMQREAAGGDKQRDLFKRFEQTLRAHTLRIEAIRRSTPPDYAVHVATTIKFARAVRTKALAAFFGEGSVREDDSDDMSRN